MNIVRIFFLIVFSVAMSLALLLLVVGRNLRDSMIPMQWAKMLVSGDPAAKMVMDYFGSSPPSWAIRLAVTWNQADPLSWWWLPFLLMAAVVILGRIARRRAARRP
jgi:hypothetical protein